MVLVGGGTFIMGSDEYEPEESPAHWVQVDGFEIEGLDVSVYLFYEVGIP